MSEKSLGAEVLPGFRVVVIASPALSETTWMKLRAIDPKEGNRAYNAVCLRNQNGNPGLCGSESKTNLAEVYSQWVRKKISHFSS